MAKKKKGAATVAQGRVCVLLLGMHRSGTSALSGVLSNLGCDLPSSLMGPSAANPKGFFESIAIRDFNNELLASAGSSWDDFLPFNENWFQSPRAHSFGEQAQELLGNEFGSSPIFVLKDPRICRLVPFWLEQLETFGCEVRSILTVRSPLEVARSIRAKKGYSEPFGQMLWLRHALDAEVSTRGLPRYPTSYDRLLQNWARVAEESERALGLNWPRPVGNIELDVQRFLESDLRHHREAEESLTDNPLLIEWLRDTYTIFTRWAQTGEDRADYAALDAIREAFDPASRAFNRLVNAERDERSTISAALKQAKEEAAASQSALARSQEDNAARQVALKDELHQVKSALAQRQHETETTAAELRALQDRLKAAENDLTQSRAEITALQYALKEAEGLVKKLRADEEKHAQEQQERFQEIRVLTNLLIQRDAAGDAFKGDLDKSRQEIAKLMQQRDGLVRSMRQLQDSTSWRLTAPLRRVMRLLRRR